MRFVTTLTTAFVLATLAIEPATAATVSMETCADAWGYSGYSSPDWNGDTNYGTQTDAYGTVMMCDWRDTIDGIANHKFWTKFDLSSFVGSASIATLDITRKSNPYTANTDQILVYALNDGDVGEEWDEYSITYNNAPGNVLDANEFDMERYTYLGSFAYPAADDPGTVYSFSNAALQQAVNADTDGQLTLGFLKRMYALHASASFASREDSFYAGATLVLDGVTSIEGALPGDANVDSVVNETDAAILADHWLMETGVSWKYGDFNGDGAVNEADATILAANWQTPSQYASVPEPSSLVLLLGVLAMVVFCKRAR